MVSPRRRVKVDRDSRICDICSIPRQGKREGDGSYPYRRVRDGRSAIISWPQSRARRKSRGCNAALVPHCARLPRCPGGCILLLQGRPRAQRRAASKEIANHPPGTKFCLHRGTYHISSTITLKSRGRLIGISRHRDGVVVKTTSAEIIFDLHHTRGVRFRHFAITGAVNACPGHNCHATGRAISQGKNVKIVNMHLYRNHQKAIGGTEGGLRVINSEIDHNGATPADALSGG